jgi:hypothetical protein
MRNLLLVCLASTTALCSTPAALASGRAPSRRMDKDEMRVVTQRVTRLATAGVGHKPGKADRKRITVGAHLLYAIRAKARREGIAVTPEDIEAQLRAWNLPAAAGDPRKARSYDEQELALALRDVAEARVLFVRLADRLGGPQKAYEVIVSEHADEMPNAGVDLKGILKAVPALIAGASTGSGNRGREGGESGASSGSSGANGDAMALLGQALSPRPAPLAKTLEKTIKQFDGNPDHLPLVYPNSALASGQR